MTERPKPPCPRCGSIAAVVDYGRLDDDDNLPPGVEEGYVPFACWACRYQWIGDWDDD